MNELMTQELWYLSITIAITALFWFPYDFINKVSVRGLMGAMGYPDPAAPLSP